MAQLEVPLFPLHTVLFPGGPLPLRIFEPRYLDMISRCLKEDSEFGVVLIRSGAETGPAETVSIGTRARIRDWFQGQDGLLGITALGTERFTLLGQRIQPDGLVVGTIEEIEPQPPVDLLERHRPLAELLERVLRELDGLYGALEWRLQDANWVGCRFAEILPLRLAEKQYCLELEDPVERLDFVAPLLQRAVTEASD